MRLCKGHGGDHDLFGNSDGPGEPAEYAATVARRNSNADRPCCTRVAKAVQNRSDHRWLVSPRVPCITTRSRTTNQIACSAKLLVGAMPEPKVTLAVDLEPLR